MPRYLLLVLLLTVAVPFQAALAVSAGQHAALEQCHEGHDGHAGHGKPAGSHCLECCAAAIASAIVALPASPFQGAVSAKPGSAPLAVLPARLDRPPRTL